MVETKKKLGGRRAPHENPVKLKTPGQDDILCGKDRACALHPGSQRFRAVIDSYRATYQKATTKYDKMCITKEIYEVLSQKARFLKYNDKEKLWEEISALAARDKVGHALRFANNHTSAIKGKKSRRSLRRQGSFSSTSATSATSSAVAPPTKKELVKNLVEVAKEEPKVWDSIVDHLTLQDALATVPNDATSSGEAAAMGAARHHQRVSSIVDPIALENIAYAVESKTDDAALDELINLLNHDETITEEDLQDVLDMAVEATSQEVPPTVTISMPEPAGSSSSCYEHVTPTSSSSLHNAEEEEQPPATYIRRTSSRRHSRHFSADDDMWSVMKEPLAELEWR